MKKIFIICLLLVSSLFGKELIEDPEFKKIGKTWTFRKAAEYDYIKKPDVSKGVFSVKTIQQSEGRLLSLSIPVELKADKKYKVSFDIRGTGEGKIYVQVRRNIDKKNKKRRLNIGLNEAPKLSGEWTEQSYSFKTISDLNKKDTTRLCIFYGLFLGEAQIKNVSLVEVK